jgi:hypothetical protein
MQTDKKQLRGLGIVFLGVGVTFLAVGMATRQLVFTTMGPSMAAMGIAFIAASRRRTP